jgi:hypothetical protein
MLTPGEGGQRREREMEKNKIKCGSLVNAFTKSLARKFWG